MTETNSVRQTLDGLIRSSGEDYASISRLIGRNQTYIQQFIKRGVPRRLAEEDRRRLAEFFGVPERLLGAPQYASADAAAHARAKSHESTAGSNDDFVFVPYYDVGASAGHGSVAEHDAPQHSLAFAARWVRGIASGGADALSVIRVEGDSMYPSLSHGDHILIDTHDRRPRDGIFVLRTEDALHVKRVAVSPSSGKLMISSDNPAYPSWADCEPDAIDIIGRVIWVGRRL